MDLLFLALPSQQSQPLTRLMCAQAGPSKKPPVVPRLGLNVDLGSSSAGPASHRTALTAFDFPADDDGTDITTLIVRS